VTTSAEPDHADAYRQFFGLKEAPFSLAPDLRFRFEGTSHSAAIAQVAYAVERREPLVVLTGEFGAGKTLLCRTVLQRMPRKTFLSVIDDPRLERDDLLKALLQDFGLISKDRTRLADPSRHELIDTVHAFLRSLAALQAHAVVMIDEAQHLQPDVLEQIRLISNTDDERGTLLQMILVGDTDLEALLSRPELRQLQQRVSRRVRLEPLHRAEVKQYIAHRLAVARDGTPPGQLLGASELARERIDSEATTNGIEFAPDAIQLITQLSGCLPRVINLLCDRSLADACRSGRRLIDRPVVQTAALTLGVSEGTPGSPGPGRNAAPDQSFWRAGRSTPPPAEGSDPGQTRARPGPDPGQTRVRPLGEIADHEGPAADGVLLPPPTPPSPLAKYLVVAVPLALAAAVTWFLVRPGRPLVPPAPAATQPAASPATRAPAAGPAAPAGPTARTSPAAAPASGRFDIVVASFRTDARAGSVAAAVASLGLPIRRRVADGWQQVVSGPFQSRDDAEAAQQRLNRSGHSGTEIVPADR
jgi:general secretion pathway protein A